MSKAQTQTLEKLVAERTGNVRRSAAGYVARVAAAIAPRMLHHTFPLQTVNPLNRRDHWRPKQQRAKRERGLTKLEMLSRRPLPPLPATVTLTRIAPRVMDSDGLAASFKHVRDGIQDAYQTDDASPLFRWIYQQKKGAYAVRIEISGGIHA